MMNYSNFFLIFLIPQRSSSSSTTHTPTSSNVIPQISTSLSSNPLLLNASLSTSSAQQLHSPLSGQFTSPQPNLQTSSFASNSPPQLMSRLSLTPQTTHKKGNRTGRQNWNQEDMIALLDAVEAVLPFDDIHWEEVGNQFLNYAMARRRSNRTVRVLKDQYEVLCKGPDTGAGGPSAIQKRARELQDRIYHTMGAEKLIDLPEIEGEKSDEKIVLKKKEMRFNRELKD
jgi:hypothetical protein